MSIDIEAVAQGNIPPYLLAAWRDTPPLHEGEELGAALQKLLTEALVRFDKMPPEARDNANALLGSLLGAWLVAAAPSHYKPFVQQAPTDRVGVDGLKEELGTFPYFHRSPLAIVMTALMFTLERFPNKSRPEQAAATVEILRQIHWLPS